MKFCYKYQCKKFMPRHILCDYSFLHILTTHQLRTNISCATESRISVKLLMFVCICIGINYKFLLIFIICYMFHFFTYIVYMRNCYHGEKDSMSRF
jgi:hypothetical protein